MRTLVKLVLVLCLALAAWILLLTAFGISEPTNWSESRRGIALYLLSFAAPLLVVLCAGAPNRAHLQPYTPGGAVLAGVIVASAATLPPLGLFLQIGEIRQTVSISGWWGWALAGLLCLVVQVTAEEVLFRRFVPDMLDPLIGRIPAALLAAALFGALHASGPAGYPGVFLAFLYGLLFWCLREMTGGLLAPIACHLAVNALALLLVSSPVSYGALALFRAEIPYQTVLPLIAVEAGCVVLLIIATRSMLRRVAN